MIPLRDSTKSPIFPIVNVTIIVLNIIIYFLEFSMEPYMLNQVYYAFGVIPAEVLNAIYTGAPFTPQLLSFVTAIFIHGGWLHVIGNMLFLWVFGDNVEGRLGHFKYLLFYLIVGAAATLAHILSNPYSTVPVVGASGAVAGVLGAYIVLFPHSRVLALVPIFIILTLVEIPAVIFIALWFVLQLFNSVASLGGDAISVAYWAHVGGFIAGVILIKIIAPRPPRENNGYYLP